MVGIKHPTNGNLVSKLPHILVLVGPTASGKTAMALSIAEKIPSEIISADSRQIFKHLTIGTAKPSKTELKQVPHHFIDLLEPDQKFNAGDFQEQGRKTISQILERKKLPIVVGGTGLYVQAIVDGFFEQPEISGEVRKLLEDRLEHEGKDALYKELQSIDPESALTMDSTKFRRVIRALEIFHETGTPISQFHKQHKVNTMYDAHFFGLNWERSVLYERINKRVDKMFAEGFLNEVKQLKESGFDDRFQSLQTVGYKEAFAYLRSEISKERMIELMKQNTRRFAKRQMTWFRKEERIHWFDISSEDQIEQIAKKIINQL
ncbi:MAG: tRNA (adenosine(37)-N6)-dimethylallyltransferase MiaA [Bacteroidota bacterium]|nr:tRNA (adenosine(37)-N6)-dimethylallyltransferase MiaA [Bacteroidota bacterium]